MTLLLAPRGVLLALLRSRPRRLRCRPLLSSAELGRVGEEVAARALAAEGWRVTGRNVRAPEAELDIVAQDGQTLVIVEVKAGRYPMGADWETWRPSRRVTPVDIQRRARAASRMARGGRWRVDVVEVVVEEDRRSADRDVRILRPVRILRHCMAQGSAPRATRS